MIHENSTYEMADNSDTESDSQGSVLVNAEDILPSRFTPSPDPSQPGTISQIIQTLLRQPLTSSVRHQEIDVASSTLIHFVDDISYRLKNGADALDVLTTFALLGMSIHYMRF